jgi:Peptidase family M28
MRAPAFILLTTLCATTVPAAAQAPRMSPHLGSESLRAVVEALAHDSLQGRATPSPGLTRAAEYLAGEFRRAGLEPGGRGGSFLWSYPLTVSALEPGRAYIQAGGRRWMYGYDWRWAGGAGARPPIGTLRGRILVVRGTLDSAAVARLPLQGRIVIYDIAKTADGQIDRAAWRNVFAMVAGAPLAVLVGGERADSAWARIRADSTAHKRAAFPAWPDYQRSSPRAADAIAFLPFLEVSDTLVRPFLRRQMQPLAGDVQYAELAEEVEIGFERRVERVEWAPNVVAILPGSDPVLRHEYVLYSAHVDGLGVEPGRGGDAVLNGADDNASGTAVILQLACAFAAEGRPRRSIVFVATSGEEIGLIGSHFLASRIHPWNGRVVANVNVDMVGTANGRLFAIVSDERLRGAHDAAAQRVGTRCASWARRRSSRSGRGRGWARGRTT